MVKDPARSRPIGDTSRWWHIEYERYGAVWRGPEPGEFSPASRAEERERSPKHQRRLEWITCRRCHTELQVDVALGTPTICLSCADSIDAHRFSKPKLPKPNNIRNIYE